MTSSKAGQGWLTGMIGGGQGVSLFKSEHSQQSAAVLEVIVGEILPSRSLTFRKRRMEGWSREQAQWR